MSAGIISPTIKATRCGEAGIVIKEPNPAFALKGNYIDRDTKQNGGGWNNESMYTLDATDRHGVCYQNTGRGWWNESGVAETLRTPCGGDSTKANLVVNSSMEGICSTLDASYYKGSGSRNGKEREYIVQKKETQQKYIVRRLTPLECCRLQGFPDWWEDGVEGSDSARYKMWGNGISLPTACDVLRRIAEV